jgi:hypothetical protein
MAPRWLGRRLPASRDAIDLRLVGYVRAHNVSRVNHQLSKGLQWVISDALDGHDRKSCLMDHGKLARKVEHRVVERDQAWVVELVQCEEHLPVIHVLDQPRVDILDQVGLEWQPLRDALE